MITVITVAYNAAETIRDTIESVMRQKNKVEHWIIDGGSTDDTIKILADYPHLKLYTGPDRGLYDAMNRGVSFANGDVIGFLNADDVFAHDCVTQEIEQAIENADCCFADLKYVTHDLKKVVRFWQGSQFTPGLFKYGWSPAHPTFYMRKDKFMELGGFDISILLGTDVIFMLRALEVQKLKSSYVPSTWVNMRVGGLSNASWKNIWRQNKHIINAHKSLGLPCNPFTFWSQKLWQRYVQKNLARSHNLLA